MRHLGIDIGSSFIKGAVLDLDAWRLTHIERTPAPAVGALGSEGPEIREIAPGALVDAVRGVLERLSAAAPDATGVLVSSQLHGVVLCDPAGRALSPCVTWQDRRVQQPSLDSAGTLFDEIRSAITARERVELGNEHVPGVPLNALYWFARRRLLPPGPVVPVALPYYVVARLGGGEPVTDVTHACGHGALHVGTLDWHRPVLERLGLAGLRWPRIVSQGAVVGEWRHAGRSRPILAPVGDFHVSQVGALLEEGELSVNVSTGSAVLRLVDGWEPGDYQTRPWFDGRFLNAITHIPGGRALQALVRLLSELGESRGVAMPDPWPYILDEAERADGGGLRVDPAFYVGSMGDRGSILNLREENMTVGHVFRAMFEGMADNYARAAARIRPERDWHRVAFSGGVALKCGVLRRLIGERMGGEHRLAPSDEDTLLGLLVLARAFTGRNASVRESIAEARLRVRA